jgi:hypothetical protein
MVGVLDADQSSRSEVVELTRTLGAAIAFMPTAGGSRLSLRELKPLSAVL